MGQNVIIDRSIIHFSVTPLKDCDIDISILGPPNFLRCTLNSFFQYPRSCGFEINHGSWLHFVLDCALPFCPDPAAIFDVPPNTALLPLLLPCLNRRRKNCRAKWFYLPLHHVGWTYKLRQLVRGEGSVVALQLPMLPNQVGELSEKCFCKLESSTFILKQI